MTPFKCQSSQWHSQGTPDQGHSSAGCQGPGLLLPGHGRAGHLHGVGFLAVHLAMPQARGVLLMPHRETSPPPWTPAFLVSFYHMLWLPGDAAQRFSHTEGCAAVNPTFPSPYKTHSCHAVPSTALALCPVRGFASSGHLCPGAHTAGGLCLASLARHCFSRV